MNYMFSDHVIFVWIIMILMLINSQCTSPLGKKERKATLTMELKKTKHNSFVLLSEIVVQYAVDNCIQAAVEVSHKIAGGEEPHRNGLAQSRLDSHCQANQIQRCPAHSKEHKHNKHGEKVAKVMWLEFELVVGLDTVAHLDDEDPDAQVAVGHNADRKDEVHHHHHDGVQRADRLSERAWIYTWVILQRLHKPVGHDGQDGEDPQKHHIAHSVPFGEDLVIVRAVADVTVAVDGDACDVKDGADDTEPHHEATDLTVYISCDPAVVKDGS